ncbi:two-partner secretion domain-containing protein [Caballeronia telluris]|uniref:Filamentous hemagglutinin-like protein n=1 Tax=Caballeronia telluris TaxID=326475 RepID=A0A158JFE8_9BURK|nr:filamentous hemagglutinin N-terminal domain-containing protein [Caballeronia telluris]SAL67576.1 filamentous hemagglutinin-like protein [Caballeronia telluris]
MRHSNYRPESAKALGFAAGCTRPLRLRPLAALVALSMGFCIDVADVLAAPPLPQNGQFVGGTGTIARNGANLDITQSGARGIINWNSFSIGAGRTVSINNGSGTTLNRVTGNAMSTIDGTLKSTGSVYLINPHGVVVGKSGVITTGGRFVASTLDADNNAFMNGFDSLSLEGTSNSAVVNLGKISSSGGDVFLIARSDVVNAGTIDAPKGSAELVAGSKVLLSDYAYGPQVSVEMPSHGRAINSGTVQAAQINLQAADGNVYALAGKNSALRSTGTETREGHVWLVADAGTVDARGANIAARNADGSGGTVDMNADTLKVAGAKVRAAQWNLTSPEFAIDKPTANTLADSLSSGTSVALNATGANKASGNIGVGSDIRWQGASSLTLDATRSVSIAPGTTIANAGAGSLTVRADSNSIDNHGSVTNNGTFDWSRSSGIVTALYDMNGSYKPGTVITNASWSPAPFSGRVTQVTGYRLVNSTADLNAINNNLGGNYALGTSFDLGFAPNAVHAIGSAAKPFTGQFDGMGHLLSSLNVSGTSSQGTGLFADIGKTGVVRNFVIAGSTASSSQGPVGLLAGVNDGRVVNVGATGSVSTSSATGSAAGGLVGVNRGSIERGWSGGATSGQGATGGLVGENDGTIVQSYSLGNASGDARSQVGGLAGANRGTITQSYSSGSVDGGNYRGGLVGNNGGAIGQSFTTSSVTPAGAGTQRPGGIAGNNTGTIARDVYWNADTSGALVGAGAGTAAPTSSRMTTAQMRDPASYGPRWDFSATGAWALPPGSGEPVLRWFLGL